MTKVSETGLTQYPQLLDGVKGCTGSRAARRQDARSGSVLYSCGSYHCSDGSGTVKWPSQETSRPVKYRPLRGHIASMDLPEHIPMRGVSSRLTGTRRHAHLRLKTVSVPDSGLKKNCFVWTPGGQTEMGFRDHNPGIATWARPFIRRKPQDEAGIFDPPARNARYPCRARLLTGRARKTAGALRRGGSSGKSLPFGLAA